MTLLVYENFKKMKDDWDRNFAIDQDHEGGGKLVVPSENVDIVESKLQDDSNGFLKRVLPSYTNANKVNHALNQGVLKAVDKSHQCEQNIPESLKKLRQEWEQEVKPLAGVIQTDEVQAKLFPQRTVSNLTAQNLKILEKNAPGPADYYPYDKPQVKDEKAANKKPLMGTPLKNLIKPDPTPGPADYQPFEGVKKYLDVVKPRHGTPGKMMPPTALDKTILEHRYLEQAKLREKEVDLMSMTTAASITGSAHKIHKPYDSLNDKQFERLFRYKFQQQAQYLDPDRCVNYKIIEPNVHTKKMVAPPKKEVVEFNNKKVEIISYEKSQVIIDRAIEKLRQPDQGTYDITVEKSQLGGKFGKEPRTKKQSFDWRPKINPNFDIVKKQAPQSVFLPEHKMPESALLKQYEQSKVGPGSNEPNFALVERRSDFGVPTIKEPYFNKENRNDYEGDNLYLVPELPKKNRLIFKYMPKTEHGPAHMPDSVANPGRWRYYDVDLDAVREQLTQDYQFAGGMNKKEFAQREEFLKLLDEHIKRTNNRRPEHGDYDAPFNPEKNLGTLNFDKMTFRYPQEIDDDDIEGDVLILDPEKLGKRIQNILFDKQLGRDTGLHPIKEEDELIIEPNFDAVRKRQPVFVDIGKQTGREERKTLDDEEVYVNNVIENDPVPNNPSRPAVPTHDFGKEVARFIDEKQKDKYSIEEELELNVNYLGDKRVRNSVVMSKGEERFKERLPADPFIADQPLNEYDNDIHKALAAIRPNVPQVIMRPDHFNKDLKFDQDDGLVHIPFIQEAKKKPQKITKPTSAKPKKKVFNPVPKPSAVQQVRNKTAKPKPQKVLQSASDEADQYIRDLGL